ncbi:hypothetical protein OIDMADRAFT_27068 [Oidiodendron maius Zn]|uniref:Uncharacterized protein n=1 Tax=Oidiodendron maius (strain Zn) TaxID=913774 RepID=A0A0C3HJP2_OIDMZ|nr:hypothetical protein OIDMADRAFT_27068 [Oidiodendron maius Zn]
MNNQDVPPTTHDASDLSHSNGKRAAEELEGSPEYTQTIKRRIVQEGEDQNEHSEDGDNTRHYGMCETGPPNDDASREFYLIDAYEAGYLGGLANDSLVGAATSALDTADSAVIQHPSGWTPVTYL